MMLPFPLTPTTVEITLSFIRIAGFTKGGFGNLKDRSRMKTKS
jgi:hypothetical protein